MIGIQVVFDLSFSPELVRALQFLRIGDWRLGADQGLQTDKQVINSLQ